MELSLEVKGYVQDVVPTKIYAWGKIITFGRRVGVDTTNLQRRFRGKREACGYIIENLPPDSAENVLNVLLDMSKLGEWNADYSSEILTEINPILERTMDCNIDENGNILPLFPLLENEPNLILAKLRNLEFDQGYQNYKDAFDTYRNSPKGSLGLLRASFEGILNEILTAKGIEITSNVKDNLAKLIDIGIIENLSAIECSNCHYKKLDHEFNHSYNLYGLLSHYGSHPRLVTDELANFIFTTTSALIWYLINKIDE